MSAVVITDKEMEACWGEEIHGRVCYIACFEFSSFCLKGLLHMVVRLQFKMVLNL